MRTARLLTILVPLVLLAPLTGVVGPAAAAEETTLTIAGKPGVGVYHDDIGPASTPDVVRHRGRLTADGAPVAGAAVSLQRKLAGGEWRTLVEDAVTDEDGRYEFFSYIKGNAQYRALYGGDLENPSAESVTVKLKAMRDFNAQLVEKESAAVFKGNLNPGWNNKVVQWQRKKCKTCSWQVIDQERSGDKGSWSFRGAYPPVNKSWYYRAAVDRGDGFIRSYSAMLITTTTPANRPAARTVR